MRRSKRVCHAILAVLLACISSVASSSNTQTHSESKNQYNEELYTEYGASEFKTMARESIKKIIYSIKCSNHAEAVNLHRSSLGYLVDNNLIENSFVKTMFEVYLDDYCYHQSGGSSSEANFDDLNASAKLCYFALHPVLKDFFLNSYNSSIPSQISPVALKESPYNASIKSRLSAIDKLECKKGAGANSFEENQLSEQSPMAQHFFKEKIYSRNEQVSKPIPVVKNQAKPLKYIKPLDPNSWLSSLGKQVKKKLDAESSTDGHIKLSNPALFEDMISDPSPPALIESKKVPRNDLSEGLAVENNDSQESLSYKLATQLADYIKSEDYLFNHSSKIVTANHTQGEHVRQVDEAIHRSVFNLICEDSPKVLAHSFLKLATLMQRYVSDDRENELAISMGDTPYSGIQAVVKTNLDQWCFDEQREQRSTTRKNKCIQTFEKPILELFQYGLIDFTKNKGDQYSLAQLKQDFENEVFDINSRLHQLIQQIILAKGNLSIGEPKIKVVCNNKKSQAPLVEHPVGQSENNSRYSNSDKVFLPPKPARATTVTTALPRVLSTEEALRTGYYSYDDPSDPDDYIYGRPHVIWHIRQAALMARREGLIYASGDINSKDTDGDGYSYTPPHSAHNYGNAADFRLMFESGWGQLGNVGDAGYSAEKTARAIEIMIDVDPENIQVIYINDEKVRKRVNAYARKKHNIKHDITQYCYGHGNHFHVHWKE